MFEALKKGLVSVGLGDIEEVPEAPAAVPVVPAAPSIAAPSTPVIAPSEDASRAAKYDESARAELEAALQGTNARLIPELQTLLATLETAIPVPATRFQTALKILTGKGTPLAAVLSEFDLYAGALEEKNRVFSKEIKDQFEARVGSKVKAVQDFDAQIAAAQSQVATLQQKIVDVTQARIVEQGGIAEAQAKLELLQRRFTLQYEATRAQIDQQKAQVAEYGKGL